MKLFRTRLKDQLRHTVVYLPNNEPLSSFGRTAFSKVHDQLNINIFNALGELQIQSQVNEIDISQLKNGLYYVTAKGVNYSATQKIIVQK